MKRLTALAVLLAAACSTAPAPDPAPTQPAAPVTQLAGTPCDPPLVIPASIVASVTAQFEEGRTTPAPPISAEDRATYQANEAKQRAADWGNLCRFRAANGQLMRGAAEPARVVFMGDSITQNWGLARPGFFNAVNVNRGIAGQTTPQMLLRFNADVIALKPAAVHIMAGVNDIAGNTGPTTLEDVENNTAAMVELAKAHGIKVILATPLPAATFSWAPALQPKESVVQLVA
ncbi:MAG TPA: GDSL-type esterase/lipase family protein [Hyphomonadaceae bacterium]|nr:GDSL-type esterase/lipase family protein [Hyphomonadaceae bacterium]